MAWAQEALGSDFLVLTTSAVTTLPRLLAYSGRPTLLLVDMEMPGLSGADIVARLQTARVPETWFYLYSAQAENQLRVKVLECGADGFIPKTDNAKEFRALVRGLFVRHLRRVLVLAGSEAARMVPGRDALEEMFEVVVARSMEAVLFYLRSRSVHVVIGSGVLTDGRAEALYRAIRKTPDTRRVSILHLALPGEEREEDAIKAAGANDVLSAPFAAASFRDLLLKLANVAPRRDVRVPLQATLSDASGTSRGATRNISVSGLLAAFHTHIAPQTELVITVPLPGLAQKILTTAVVVRAQPSPADPHAFGLR
ncbi:MAG: response regulator, partial [Deltaproteobacteria bacterium]|nr:response regulator [Deltaproteobacteria bacterium]